MNQNAPGHWRFVPLSEVAEIVTGNTPSKSKPEYYGDTVPFVTPAELDADSAITTAKTALSEIGAKEARLLPPETVLVCCIGSLGKTGITGVTTATNQQINALIFDPLKVYPKYGYYVSKRLQPTLEHIAPSTTVAIVNKSRFGELHIPLPPLKEQRRIAAILDKADAIHRKRQRTIELTETFLRSVFLDMFGDPVTNPKGWTTKHLDEIFCFSTGKLDSNAAVEDGRYPFFTCSKTNFKIDEYAFDCEALLLSGNNAAGEYSVKHFKGKFNAYQRTYVITLSDSGFCYPYFQKALEFKLSELKRFSKGTNTKYLTMGILSEMTMQVPNQVMVNRFADISKFVKETTKSKMQKNYLCADLVESLTTRAFKGELTQSTTPLEEAISA